MNLGKEPTTEEKIKGLRELNDQASWAVDERESRTSMPRAN